MQKGIYTIVDVETTGMRAESARVIDIGIIRIEDGVVVEKYQTLINPGVNISSTITAISGLSNEDVIDAPTFEDVSGKILGLFEDAIFVAHNASFDYSFIKAEFARVGIEFHAPMLCTVKLSRELYPKHRRHNLDALIDRFGFDCETRHRALPDAEVLWQFFNVIDDEHDPEKVSQSIKNVMLGREKPVLFDRKKIAALPDSPGIYFFYSKDNELLYIGKSKHIRTRVRSHFANQGMLAERKLLAEVARIETRETPGEMSALLLESYMIKRELPIYNRMQRKLKEMIAVTVVKDKQGYLVPKLEKKEHLDINESLISVFRNMTQAKAKFRAMAEEHRLCHKLMGIEKTDRACFGLGLGHCNGACLGKESADEYNKRFNQAFKTRKIRTWPFPGTIMIDEQGKDGTGAVFFIKDWRLLASYQYDNADRDEFIPAPGVFDFDSYKIFARYLLDPANKRSIKHVAEVPIVDYDLEYVYE